MSSSVKEFTHDELLLAWQQMKKAQVLEENLVQKASQWIANRCELSVSIFDVPPQYCATKKYSSEAPWLPSYFLSIECSQYDHPNDWLKDQLTRPKNVLGLNVGFSIKLKFKVAEGLSEEREYGCILSEYSPPTKFLLVASGWPLVV